MRNIQSKMPFTNKTTTTCLNGGVPKHSFGELMERANEALERSREVRGRISKKCSAKLCPWDLLYVVNPQPQGD